MSFDLRRRDPLVLLAQSCAAILLVLYIAFALTPPGQRLDATSLEARHPLISEHVARAEDFLTTTSAVVVILVGTLIVLVALARRRLAPAVAAGAVIVGANLTTLVLKWVLPRPELFTGGDNLGGANHFPSGSTTAAMSLALAAVLIASPRTRGVLAMILSLYVAAVAVATFTAGWHRPSEVAGGLVVATAWAAGVMAWDSRRDPDANLGSRVVAPLLLIVGALLTVCAVAGLTVELAGGWDRSDVLPEGGAYVVAALALAASALVLIGAVLVAVRAARTSAPLLERARG